VTRHEVMILNILYIVTYRWNEKSPIHPAGCLSGTIPSFYQCTGCLLCLENACEDSLHHYRYI